MTDIAAAPQMGRLSSVGAERGAARSQGPVQRGDQLVRSSVRVSALWRATLITLSLFTRKEHNLGENKDFPLPPPPAPRVYVKCQLERFFSPSLRPTRVDRFAHVLPLTRAPDWPHARPIEFIQAGGVFECSHCRPDVDCFPLCASTNSVGSHPVWDRRPARPSLFLAAGTTLC